MTRLRLYLVISLVLLVKTAFTQTYFEGEITYAFELEKKDSAFDETSIPSYPSKITRGIVKDGNWLQMPDNGIVEYLYFNYRDNKIYWKLRDIDTLYFEEGANRRATENDSIIISEVKFNTDTLLGYRCNSFTLQTSRVTLTFIYSPLLAINPAWYKHTKMGYYDAIYGKMKSIFLISIVETPQFISRMVAQAVNKRPVSENEFPDTGSLPKVKL